MDRLSARRKHRRQPWSRRWSTTARFAQKERAGKVFLPARSLFVRILFHIRLSVAFGHNRQFGFVMPLVHAADNHDAVVPGHIEELCCVCRTASGAADDVHVNVKRHLVLPFLQFVKGHVDGVFDVPGGELIAAADVKDDRVVGDFGCLLYTSDAADDSTEV